MIKTHKPRGHIWTHASAFQQTEKIRNINLEECIAPRSKVLLEDSDEPLLESERFAKRRRIEKIADDFLNGVPLFIASAKPCPESLKSTITWNKRNTGDSKFVLPKIDRDGDSRDGLPVWQDVESEAEVLERLRQRRGSRVKPVLCETVGLTKHGVHSETIQAEQARASCEPVRRLRKPNVSTGPSEDALNQAAALRARKSRRAESEIPVAVDGLLMSTATQKVDQEPKSEPAYGIAEQHHRSEARHWLSRRKSRTSFAEGEGHDDSIDELQLSGTYLRPLSARISTVEPERAPTTSMTGRRVADNSRQDQSMNLQASGDESSSGSASYDTAPASVEIDRIESRARESSELDHGEPLNPVDTLSQQLPKVKPKFLTTSARLKSAGSIILDPRVSISVTRAATLNQEHSLTHQSSFMCNQGGRDTTRSEPKRSAYTIAQSSQNGSTPLMFRKGRLRSREASAEREKGSKGMQDTPLNPDLTMGDEHLNSRLPSKPDSEKRSSDVKKVVPREMRNSGAEIIRCAVEPPGSSQAEAPRQQNQRLVQEAEPVDSNRQATLDTQSLLKQAQRDLITSPEKQSANDSSAKKVTPPSSKHSQAQQSSGRKTLKQLSQEPMPSTQQLLAGFDGFSTVKKPRIDYRESHLLTPTATGKVCWTAINSTKQPIQPFEADSGAQGLDLSRSSLRFSVPSAASTSHDGSAGKVAPTALRPSLSSSDQVFSGSKSTATNSTPRQCSAQPSGVSVLLLSAPGDGSSMKSASSTVAAPISSFQAAQLTCSLPSEPSNVDETIDDLTRDVLGMADLAGVLSQV